MYTLHSLQSKLVYLGKFALQGVHCAQGATLSLLLYWNCYITNNINNNNNKIAFSLSQGRPLWLPHCVNGESLNFCDAVCSGEEVSYI